MGGDKLDPPGPAPLREARGPGVSGGAPAPGDRVAAFLRSRSGGSPATVDTYRRRLKRYAEWNGGTEIDRDRYDAYLAQIRREGRRANGLALDAQVLLLYAEFAGVDTGGWQRVRWREVPVQWLRDSDHDALRRALLESRHDGEDRAFVVDFLRGTGLRLRELLDLRWRDVDLERGIVTVRSGKGGRMRAVPIPHDGPPALARAAQSAVDAFWRRHPDRSLDEARLLRDWVSPFREPWQIHNFLRSAAARAGLSGLDVHPHVFRHSYAVDLTLRGVPQAVVQRLLGHRSPATTGRYQQIAPVDIIAALRTAGGG